jgi:hypothetical protein
MDCSSRRAFRHDILPGAQCRTNTGILPSCSGAHLHRSAAVNMTGGRLHEQIRGAVDQEDRTGGDFHARTAPACPPPAPRPTVTYISALSSLSGLATAPRTFKRAGGRIQRVADLLHRPGRTPGRDRPGNETRSAWPGPPAKAKSPSATSTCSHSSGRIADDKQRRGHRLGHWPVANPGGVPGRDRCSCPPPPRPAGCAPRTGSSTGIIGARVILRRDASERDRRPRARSKFAVNPVAARRNSRAPPGHDPAPPAPRCRPLPPTPDPSGRRPHAPANPGFACKALSAAIRLPTAVRALARACA